MSLQLLGQLQPRRSLDAIIEDMSQQAQAHGLTQDILDDMLEGKQRDNT